MVDSDEEEEEDNNNNNNNNDKSAGGRSGTMKQLLQKLAEDMSEMRVEMRDLQEEVKWGMDWLQRRLMLAVTGVREPTKWQDLPLAKRRQSEERNPQGSVAKLEKHRK